MTTVRKVIEGARSLLLEKQWCHGTFARTKDGVPCSGRSPDAAQFDICAALILQGNGEEDICVVETARGLVENSIPDRINLATWNDAEGRTREEVISLLELTLTRIPSSMDPLL